VGHCLQKHPSRFAGPFFPSGAADLFFFFCLDVQTGAELIALFFPGRGDRCWRFFLVPEGRTRISKCFFWGRWTIAFPSVKNSDAVFFSSPPLFLTWRRCASVQFPAKKHSAVCAFFPPSLRWQVAGTTAADRFFTRVMIVAGCWFGCLCDFFSLNF